MMSSYAEPQGELPPQLQQQQQQGLSPNVTASPSSQLQQQQGLSPNVTASPSSQLQQQQAPPITFQPGEGEGEEPCDGAYFVGPGGVTKCM
jgi:hypothetical protein